LTDDDDDPETSAIHTARRVPIYRKLGDFRTRQLRSIFHHLLNNIEKNAAESLPDEVIARCNLIPRVEALRKIHFPAVLSPIVDFNLGRSAARRRLICEEFFWLSLALGLRRGERMSESNGEMIEISDRVRLAVCSILPFQPPNAQKLVLKEIVDDITG